MAKLSGGLNNWYVVSVKHPQRKEQEPYQAECEDIIQALGMTFDEGCAFKALWRNAAARMGNGKPGNTTLYDCEKLVHYSNRLLAKAFLLAKESEEVAKKEDTEIPPDILTIGGCWHYLGSGHPYFTKKFTSIEVVYKTELDRKYIYSYSNFREIQWNRVLKYRINY